MNIKKVHTAQHTVTIELSDNASLSAVISALNKAGIFYNEHTLSNRITIWKYDYFHAHNIITNLK